MKLKSSKQFILLASILAILFILLAAPATADSANVDSADNANSNLTTWNLSGTEPHVLTLDADNWTGGTITIPLKINNLTIQSDNANVQLAGTTIVAASGRTTPLQLTIKNLNLSAPTDAHGIDIDGVSGTILYLEGNNTITGSLTGIHVGSGNFLTITADGSVKDSNNLTVYGGPSSAGIGGKYNSSGNGESSGKIVINGFVVIDEVKGGGGDGGGGAAIGGGYGGDGTVTLSDSVTITTATGGIGGGNSSGGAAIGGGGGGAGTVTLSDSVTITTATGGGGGEFGGGGAAIGGGGGGDYGGDGTVTLSDSVTITTATGGGGGSGGGGAAIGGGGGGDGYGGAGDVTVSESVTITTATGGGAVIGSGGGGAAIGGGGGGYGGYGGAGDVTVSESVTITTATGGGAAIGGGGAAIGGGGGGYYGGGAGAGTVTIKGGTIVVTPVSGHYAIGGGQGSTNGTSTIVIDGGSIRTTTGTLFGASPTNSNGNTVTENITTITGSNDKMIYLVNNQLTTPITFGSRTDADGKLYLYSNSSSPAKIEVIKPNDAAVFADKDATMSVPQNAKWTYQWYKSTDGTNFSSIAGETGNSLSLTSVGTTDNGSKYRVVINEGKTAGEKSLEYATGAATLTVYQQPANTAAFVGNDASFTVVATGETGLTYQWQKNISGTWTDVSGANSATYTINSVSVANAGNYRVVVTGPGTDNTATSDEVTLVVLSTHPANTTVFEGKTASFSVTTTHETLPVGLSYQWYHESSSISGANSSTYSIDSMKSTDYGNYTLIVKRGGSNVSTSSTARVYVMENPKSTVAFEGTNASFSVPGILPTNFSYQWQKNDSGFADITNETSATYEITGVAQTDAGEYRVLIMNGSTVVSTSDTVTLTTITNPVDMAVFEGNQVSFSVTGILPTGFSYQWQKTGLGAFRNIPDKDGAELIISAADKTNDTVRHRLLIRKGYDTVSTSDAVWLTVVTHPSDITEFENRDITFAVAQNPGTGVSAITLAYKWYKSPNTNPIAGATTRELALTNITLADNGSYYAKIDGMTDSSDSADLVVLAQPVNQTVQEHHPATFAVTDRSGLSYQWLVDKNDTNGFVELTGETNASLDIDALLNMNDWKYKVQVSGNGIDGMIESDEVVLTVTKTPASGGYGGDNVRVVDGNQTGQQQQQPQNSTNGTENNGTQTNANGANQPGNGSQNGSVQNGSGQTSGEGFDNGNETPTWIWIVAGIIGIAIVGGAAYWYFVMRKK
ncbi:hypothetical protein [Methanolapillus millepedarum]|uniref:Immunoglobulin domain-containing protein n=1 Tax=Methanolapillus millepedarum TaxID=3028296 RepID=A0AA96VE68_9EURY|nr:hypothetical protein MsAc7_05390 [Methanosarcinaceae archaeon Ac7]